MPDYQTYNIKIYGTGIIHPVDDYLEIATWLVDLASQYDYSTTLTASQQSARDALVEFLNKRYTGTMADPAMGFGWNEIALVPQLDEP